MSDALFNSNKPGSKDSDIESGIPDTPTPLNSAGTPTQKYKNAAGKFDITRELRRKIKSRKDLNQPGKGKEPMRDGTDPQYGEGPMSTGGTETDGATDRYFGSFSIESKRNVMDLLETHPKFAKKGNVNLGRVANNTREVLPKDPTKVVQNGGHIVYEDQPQASQPKYSDGTKTH